MYNPNFPPTNPPPSQDAKVKKAINTEPTSEEELNQRFFIPYLDAKDDKLEDILRKLESELLVESQKAGNENNPVIAFIHALISQELYLLMKHQQARYVAHNSPPGKSMASLSDEELNVLSAKFPLNQEIQQRLEHSIASYREATDSVWDMKPSPNTKVDQITAQTMLGDMLYRKASSTEDLQEKKALIAEADGLYSAAIKSDFLDNGQKDELKLIALLRATHQKYSPDKPFLVEHGTPREDLRDTKADLKMYCGVQSYLIQLKTLTANDYVKEFNEGILERARQHVAAQTLVVKVSAPSLRDAYADPGRVNLRRVVDEFANGIGRSGGEFNLRYLLPAVETKPQAKKKVNRRTVETDVQKFVNVRSLRQFGFEFEPTAAGVKEAKDQLLEALLAAMEADELHVTKEMLTNPPDEVVAIMKKYLLDKAA